jgi:phosphoribosylformylglycinamidine (FGAM) synthase-like amidotransferase family enzyme
MAQTRYAFIIKAPGYHRNTHVAHMESPAFDTEFIGVEDFEEAMTAAEALIVAGTQVIELCGGFSTQESATLRHRFPGCDIGRVTYS